MLPGTEEGEHSVAFQLFLNPRHVGRGSDLKGDVLGDHFLVARGRMAPDPLWPSAQEPEGHMTVGVPEVFRLGHEPSEPELLEQPFVEPAGPLDIRDLEGEVMELDGGHERFRSGSSMPR